MHFRFPSSYARICMLTVIFACSTSLLHAQLINQYTFDDMGALGTDSIGTRNLTQFDVGTPNASHMSSVTDSNGLTRLNVLRLSPETQNGDANTTNGSRFSTNTGGGTFPNYTVSTWIRTDIQDNAGFSGFFANGTGADFQLDTGNNGVNPDNIRYNGDGGVIDGPTLGLDTWRHVVLSQDTGSNTTTLFVDGVSVGTGSFSNNDFTAIRIGSNRGENRFFDGDIDDTSIWSETLTSDEIAGLYSVAIEPTLGYEADEFDLLKQVHDGTLTEAIIGDYTWTFGTGLAGAGGDLTLDGNDFNLVLDSNANTGVVGAAAAVPEPASIALWSLLGLGLVSFGYLRKRRK